MNGDFGMDRQLGDFAHVDVADAGNLVERLDHMHALDAFQTYKSETFDLLCLLPGSKVADVGCGTGDDARKVADRVGPNGDVIGFDLSEAMLAEARQRHKTKGLSFRQAPSDKLDMPDGSFDAIRADRVLIHVPDPFATLTEMLRVTKPGGRVVISEPDMPGCWAASDDYATTDLVMREIANSCATPFLPRDLWVMFKDAGLSDVSLTVRSVTAFDPVSVSKILDFQGVMNRMVVRGILSEAQATTWGESFANRGKAGRFVVGVSIMIVAGTKL